MSALRLEQLCVPSSTGTLPQHLLDAMAALRNEDIKTRIAQQEETLNEVTDEIKKINDETGTCLETLKTVKGRYPRVKLVVASVVIGETGEEPSIRTGTAWLRIQPFLGSV